MRPIFQRASNAGTLSELLSTALLVPGAVLRWWSDFSLRTKGFVVVAIPLCAMFFGLVSSYVINRRHEEAALGVQHSIMLHFEIDKLLDGVTEADRGVYSYLLNHNPEFLAPYNTAKTTLPALTAKLFKLVRNDPAQTARMLHLQSLVNGQLALSARMVERSAVPVPEQGMNLIESKRGDDALCEEIDTLDAEIQRLQAEQARQLARVERLRLIANAGGAVSGLLGALVTVQLFSQGIVRRLHRLQENADRLAEGSPLLAFLGEKDEIGVLARHQDQAARLLRERSRALDESLQRLRKSEHLYRALARNFPNGSIFLFDHDLRYLVADGQGLAANGFSREKVEGRTFAEVMPAAEAVLLEPFYHATLAGETQAREILFGERLYLTQFLPLKDEEGRVYAGLIVTQDISGRKRHEEALRAARDEAERANLAKSQFLSRMSHELRTPLNAILGFGQLLALNDLPEQEAECVGHVLAAGRHLLSLIDEVLDLARVEAGELRLKLSAVRLDVLVPECIAFVARLAQGRAVTCTLEASEAFRVPVLADAQRLRQILLNLLSNAIKYNRQGGQVSLRCEQTPDGRIRLEVRDTGRGMSPEDLARLFVPFERLGQELGEVEGTGLGLVVSRQLMGAMGGRLEVQSQVEVGTSLWIELPGMKTTPPATAPSGANGNLAAMPRDDRPATVLYIEDNASNLQVVDMIVARLRPHWRLLSARDGISGLRAAREQRPECILLDRQLPGMNGDEVLCELRADAATRQIPVLLISADVMTHAREAALALGAADYLPKPFEVGELLEKLDSQIIGRPSFSDDAGRSSGEEMSPLSPGQAGI